MSGDPAKAVLILPGVLSIGAALWFMPAMERSFVVSSTRPSAVRRK